jgi:hypothetical protein
VGVEKMACCFGYLVKCEVAQNKRSVLVELITTSNAARCCIKRFKHDYVTVLWAFKPSVIPKPATTPQTGGDSASKNVEATENSVQAEGVVPGKSPTPHYTRIKSYSDDDGLLLRLQTRRT